MLYRRSALTLVYVGSGCLLVAGGGAAQDDAQPGQPEPPAATPTEPELPPEPALPAEAAAPPEPAPPAEAAAPPEPAPPSTAPPAASFAPLPAPAPAPSPTPYQTTPAPRAAPPVAGPTAAGAPPPAALSAQPASAPEPEQDGGGLFGPFRIGFLVGTGLPNVLNFGGAIKLTDYFGAGLNVGLIPKVKVSIYGDATLSYREYDVYGRLFPFGGAFFLGAGVGYATVRGTLVDTVDLPSGTPGLPSSIDITSQASVRTLVLTPQLGLQHTFKVGLTLGIDVGAQIPIAPSQIDFTTQVPSYVPQAVVDEFVTPIDRKVRDTLETVGRTTVPTINLRIGWLL